jgi:hypothetical protein
MWLISRHQKNGRFQGLAHVNATPIATKKVAKMMEFEGLQR